MIEIASVNSLLLSYLKFPSKMGLYKSGNFYGNTNFFMLIDLKVKDTISFILIFRY